MVEMPRQLEKQALALLTRIGRQQSRNAQADSPGMANGPEVRDYDWTSPSSFTRPQLDALKTFAEKLAQQAAMSVSKVIRSPLEMRACPLKQYYQRALQKALAQRSGYVVPLLDAAGEAAGFIWLSAATAGQWCARMLGASACGQERELSSLESALLLDAVAAVVAAINSAGSAKLRRGEAAAKTYQFPDGDGKMEFSEFALACGAGDGSAALSIVLTGAAAISMLKLPSTATAKGSAEEARKLLLRAVEQAGVRVTVELGSATISVGDMVGLECGDVLLLSTAVGQDVEARVGGKTFLTGQPVVCEGRYALSVTERCGNRG